MTPFPRGLCGSAEVGHDGASGHPVQRAVGHDGLPGHGRGHRHRPLRGERVHVDLRPDGRALHVRGPGGHGENCARTSQTCGSPMGTTHPPRGT